MAGPDRPPHTAMGSSISVEEILGTIHDGTMHVCAIADGDYDHSTGRISIALEAFTRSSAPTDGAHIPQPWLPKGERVTEHLPYDEADEFVKDVFQSWLEKIRASIPEGLILRP